MTLAIAAARDRLVGRGLAINIYSADSYMAQVAEVSVARDLRDLRVHRIVCVFDCGRPLNPAGLEGQVESGIAWGLSATLPVETALKPDFAKEIARHFKLAAPLVAALNTPIAASLEERRPARKPVLFGLPEAPKTGKTR